MFDYVDAPPMKCWGCPAIIDGWQSKDGPCGLSLLPWKEVTRFYNHCNECGAWNQYQVEDDGYYCTSLFTRRRGIM